MRYFATVLPVIMSVLPAGCRDNRPDAEVVSGLRGLYPGGLEFGSYSKRIIGRGAEIVPELVDASRDTDSKMRESAARCLGQIGGDAAVSRLLEMLSDSGIEDTIWISLSYSRSARAIEPLRAQLATHSDVRARGRLLITLVECGDDAQLSSLLDYMKITKLEGHLYHANQALERLAGRRFGGNIADIEAWIQSRQPTKP